MSAPLTKGQKSYLSQLAQRAFLRQCALARGRGEVFADGQYEGLAVSVAQEKFRHAQVAQASGKLGLRCCSQDDYKLVEGHFLELLGQPGAALKAQVRAATETRRVIEHKIVQACAEFGFAMSYAHKICTSQNHGQGLDEVGEKQLWNVFYTIRNRGNARKQKAAMPSTGELCPI